jgi:hypothetical protein
MADGLRGECLVRPRSAAKVAAVLQDGLLGNQPSLQLIKICHCWSFLEIPIQLMVDMVGSSAMVDFPRSFP